MTTGEQWLRKQGFSQWPDGVWQRDGYEADNLGQYLDEYAAFILEELKIEPQS